MNRILASLVTLGLLVCTVIGPMGCSSDPPHCRYNPECNGGIGAFCDFDNDCIEGFCCDSANCGGGMCTYSCGDDLDCPSDMLCEHGNCFFACDFDADCADGQTCEHASTVCEWN